jgi:molybdenum cofactor cytidylyltransferase
LVREVRCDHSEEALTVALDGLLDAAPQMVLVVGASAIVDRRDVVPAAIAGVGGELDHFGMPVDPGNLLLLAHRGDTPLLGLPGCARSPAYNGFDQVLERLLAGVTVAGADIMTMGVGGLLKETHERAQPRASVEAEDTGDGAPRVAALVLAAGQSRRMGARNKLLEAVDGIPMVIRAVDAAAGGVDAGVYVVTGHEHEEVAQALAGRHVHLVHNPRYREGLSTSLAAGLAALGDDVDGVLICLGDMPRVTRAHIKRLIDAFDRGHAAFSPRWATSREMWARDTCWASTPSRYARSRWTTTAYCWMSILPLRSRHCGAAIEACARNQPPGRRITVGGSPSMLWMYMDTSRPSRSRFSSFTGRNPSAGAHHRVASP